MGHYKRLMCLCSVASTKALRLALPNANDNIVDDLTSRVGRSHFNATGICCSLETPNVKSILLPIKGVDDVHVSSVTKVIYVIHHIDIVSSSDLCFELGERGFHSTIIKD